MTFHNVKKHLENPDYPYDQDIRYTHRNGSTVWIHCRGLAIRDQSGKPIRMIGSHHDITAIKNKEKESGLLAEMLDIAPNSITIHDATGKFLYANQKTFEIHGYSSEEFMAHNLNTIDVPESAELIQQRINDIQENGHAKFEVEHFKKDGSKIPLEVYVKLVDWKGSPALLSIATDISERKKMLDDLLSAKNAIEASRQFYKLTFGEAAVGLAHVLPNGKIFKINNKFCEITGYSEDELINMNFVDISHPEDLIKENIYIQQVLENEIDSFTIEKRYRHKKGHFIWIILYSNVVRDENGTVKFAICSISEITKEKKLHRELLKSNEKLIESEAKLKLALDVANIAYWRHEIVSGKVEWSDGHERLFGIPIGEFKNTLDSVQSFIHPDDRGYGEVNLQNAIKNDMPYDNTYRVIYPNGDIHWLHSVGVLFKNEKGINTHLFGVTQDITDTIENEIELVLAKEKAEESNRLKTEFLNNLSHEIRTPMNGIIGFSELLNEPDLSDEKRKYFAKIVQNSSQQLLRIIDDILEISTLETKQVKVSEDTLCLNDLIMELFSIFNLKSKERNIPIYVKKALHDTDSYIVADKIKLNKVLGNLLANSLKFTNEGYVEIGYYISDNNLVLYVKDTGIGISTKNHSIIFDRFSQEDKEISKKHGGLGLGLSIAKENAILLGGDITLESEKGKGSTFFVTIPYIPKHIVRQYSTTPDDATVASDKKKYAILVAEDEDVNYMYLETLFEAKAEFEYHIIHARNGREAVEICTENRNIDIVLMDIKMPVMNGHEASKKIKQEFPNLPIIAQTAYSTAGDKELASQYGCDDFISKPIDRIRLFELIKKHLRIA